MSDLDNLARWQATMDMAVYKFEKRTGLKLAGLSPTEISQRIKQWTSGHKLTDRTAYKLNKTSGDEDDDPSLVLESHPWRKKGSAVPGALSRKAQ